MPPKSPKKKGSAKARERRRLAKLQELKIRESRGHVEVGTGYVEKGNFSKGIVSFTQAIEVNPDNLEAYLFRGRALKELKAFDKAIYDFSKAIDLNPQDPQGYAGRGNAYESIEDYDKAIDDFTKVIELVPDDDHAYNMRGNARQAKRIAGLRLKNAEFVSVISDFTRALEINPYNYYAYCNRANAYYDRKEFRSAIADYSQSINIKLDYLYAYLRRGIAYYEAVLYDEHMAKQRSLEEAQLQQAGPDGARRLPPIPASPEEQQQQWEQDFKDQEEESRKEKEKVTFLESAITDFTQVITFDEDDTKAYGHRAKVYSMLTLPDRAAEDHAKIQAIEAKMAKERR